MITARPKEQAPTELNKTPSLLLFAIESFKDCRNK